MGHTRDRVIIIIFANYLKIIQWNLKGFYAKLPNLHKILDEYSPNIVCIQESCLSKNSIIRLKNFHYPPIRKDRVEREGRGVAIFISSSIPYINVHYNGDQEAVIVSFYVG